MTPVLQHMLSTTYTVPDLHRRVRLLHECLEAVLYDEPQQLRVLPVKERREKAINERANESDAKALLELDEKLWDGFTAVNFTTKIKALIKESEELSVMTIYVPVEFTDKQLAPLSDWVRREVTPGLMLEVEIDPKVVGGCSFVYKDNHFDWSLRRYLRSKQGLVTTLLNSYAG